MMYVVELISMLNPMDQSGHYWYLYSSAAGRKGLNLWLLEIRYSALDSISNPPKRYYYVNQAQWVVWILDIFVREKR